MVVGGCRDKLGRPTGFGHISGRGRCGWASSRRSRVAHGEGVCLSTQAGVSERLSGRGRLSLPPNSRLSRARRGALLIRRSGSTSSLAVMAGALNESIWNSSELRSARFWRVHRPTRRGRGSADCGRSISSEDGLARSFVRSVGQGSSSTPCARPFETRLFSCPCSPLVCPLRRFRPRPSVVSVAEQIRWLKVSAAGDRPFVCADRPLSPSARRPPDSPTALAFCSVSL